MAVSTTAQIAKSCYKERNTFKKMVNKILHLALNFFGVLLQRIKKRGLRFTIHLNH